MHILTVRYLDSVEIWMEGPKHSHIRSGRREGHKGIQELGILLLLSARLRGISIG